MDVDMDLASEKERVESINHSNKFLKLMDESVDLMRNIIRRARDIIGCSITVICRLTKQKM